MSTNDPVSKEQKAVAGKSNANVLITVIATIGIVGVIVALWSTQGANNSQTTNTSADASTQSSGINTQPTNSTSDNSQNTSYYTLGSESLCSQGAQEYASSMTQSGLQVSQGASIPASSYFVVASHYVSSQNSCYIELHNQLPLPQNQGVIDDYTLYVEGGPSGYDIKGGTGGIPDEVASCATYPRNQSESGGTLCSYYYPVEKDQVEGNMTYTSWGDQYNSKNAPPMSQSDFQTLVQQDMAAN